MVQNWYLHHTFFTQVPVIAKVRVMVFNATFNSVIGGGNRSIFSLLKNIIMSLGPQGSLILPWKISLGDHVYSLIQIETNLVGQ